jgi:hypothetical protein
LGHVDVEVQARARLVVEDLVRGLDNDAKGGRAAAAERPEEVRVGLAVGRLQDTVGSDDLELEGRVGEEAVEVGQRAVAAALDETARNADSL